VSDTVYGDFPLKRYLGLELDGDEPGRARACIGVGDEHLNPNGMVHGAVLFAMVDTAMGKATMSVLPEGRFCASVEVHLRFLRPANEGVLVADVEVIKRGRAIVYLDGRVRDADDRLIATATGTFAVIGGEWRN
jgi:acyl-CoA thioesterase